MKIKKLHLISGIIITVYVFFHLINHLVGFFGVDRYMEVMESFRVVYRNPVVESILLLAVAFQGVSGITLFIRYLAGWIKERKKVVFFDQLQIWTGLYLSYFLINHVWAVLAGRYIAHVDTGFYYGAGGLNVYPSNLFFIPYYGLAIIAFFGHVSAIYSKVMKKEVLRLSPSMQAKFIFGFGIVLTIIIFYGLTNGFRGFEIPSEFYSFEPNLSFWKSLVI